MSRYSDTILADAPLGYWRLGERAGAGQDSSGYGRSAASTGSIVYQATGAIANDPDRAMTFDGIGAFMDIAYSAALNPGAFSAECWAWIDPSNPVGNRTIYNSGTTTTGWAIRYNAGAAVIQFIVQSAGGSTFVPPAGVANVTGAWHHLVGTYDGTTARFYIDGALVGTVAGAFALNTTTSQQVARDTAGGSLYKGSIDEVAFYGVALSATQILIHYKAGIAASTGINSAMQPVQTTVYTTLTGDAGLAALVGGIGSPRIYDEVPASYDKFPYVQIGEVNETIDNTFSTTGRAVEVSIHTYTDAKGWKEIQLILEELIRLLDLVLLPNPTGWTTYENHYVLGQEIRNSDGTRQILARFVFHVERAGH